MENGITKAREEVAFERVCRQAYRSLYQITKYMTTKPKTKWEYYDKRAMMFEYIMIAAMFTAVILRLT